MFLFFIVSILLVFDSPKVTANPKNGTVVKGSADIVQESAKKLTVNQHTNKAIINWQSFSINADEHTHFQQPSSSSIALNRVTGNDPSAIFGRLSANGRLMLINRNGILFGRNSRIDVNSLLATTHDIKNDDFMAGRFNFNIPGKPNAAVINEGNITVADRGISALVAPSVKNNGAIVAKMGKVAIASANGFTLDLYGDELVTLLVGEKVAETALDLKGNPLESFVDNQGSIEADGGYVLLTANAAREAVNSVINHSGIIKATSIEEKNGKIVLKGGDNGIVSVTGLLVATNSEGKGGRIEVTGEKVGLFSGANLDTSGKKGGGTVLIGGDYFGGTADFETVAELGVKMEDKIIPTAQFTYMDLDAVIQADALTNGDGGKIVVWADDTARVYGGISARGGEMSGDGGFIETSGKLTLDMTGISVDASAKNGIAGTWLLDPADLTVGAAEAAAIMASLNTGTNSIINASDRVDITSDITKSSGDDATFRVNSFFIYQHEGTNVTSGSGKLNVEYEATDRVWIGRGWIGGESNFATNGGDITFHGPNFVGVNGTIDAGSGNILIKAENKEPTGADKGIWIFGNTMLIGNTITKISKSTIRIDPGTSEIVGVAESTVLGMLQRISGTFDILTGLADNTAGEVLEITALHGNTKGAAKIIDLTRQLSGTNMQEAQHLSKTLGDAALLAKVVLLVMDFVDIGTANNAGAFAESVNTLTRDLVKCLAGYAAGKLGGAAGAAGGAAIAGVGAVPGSIILGGASAIAGGYYSGKAYDKWLATAVVEVAADTYRGYLKSGSAVDKILGI